MANLVVCCDGTWNTPDEMDGGLPSPTNVSKLYNAVMDDERNGVSLKYYHPGVGTDGGIIDKIAGGGMGVGLTRNIKSAYKWIGTNYRPGDHIWIFGFSRGAFTARCVAGLVTTYGLLDLSDDALPDKGVWERVDQVYDRYRDKNKVRLEYPYHNGDAVTDVYFVGVWDTVGSHGIPDDLAFLNLLDDPTKYQFHDTELNDHVLNARHALALDERRQTFIPTLWTNVEDRKTVKQIWFAGVHCDVGGGYAQAGLSDITLQWMMQEVSALDPPLPLRGVQTQLNPNWGGILHDSAIGIFQALATRPRNVPALIENNDIHETALQRIADPPIIQGRYWRHVPLAPGAQSICDVFARQKWNSTGIYLEAGVKYQLTAKGEWKDASIPCGPDGTDDGKFHIGEAVQIGFSMIGKLETAYRSVFKQEKAEFWGTKRVESASWFALIGVVASGGGPDEDWNQEQFVIGSSASFTPRKSGYLHCFANDAWIAYDNNLGSVRLTVKRV